MYRAVALAALGLVGCGGSGATPDAAVVQIDATVPPIFTVMPAVVSFSGIAIGATSLPSTVMFANTGGTAATPASITVGGSSSFQLVSTTCGASLGAHASCSASVAFAPMTPGAHAGTITISSGTASASAALTGDGLVQGDIFLSPGVRDYGLVVSGSSTLAQSFTLRNPSSFPTGMPTISVTGANASEFVIDATTCNAPLAAFATCTIDVSFHAALIGTRTATLQVVTNPGGTATAGLQATAVGGPYLVASPTSVDFGPWLVGTPATQQTVTITNVAAIAAPAPAVSVFGAAAADYQITSTTCSSGIASGSACAVVVQFTPSTLGPRTAVVDVISAGFPSLSFTVTGNGASGLTMTPSTHDFGGFALGCPTLVQRFTLTNFASVATGTLVMTTMGSDASMFHIESSTTCGSSLAPSASCTIDVGFHPTSVGARSALLEVRATPGGTATTALSGTGLAPIAVFATPSNLAFGMVVVGTTAPTKDVSITSNCSSALPAPTVAITGTAAADFQVMPNGCAAGLPAFGTCTLSMAFTPSTTGSRTAQVNAAFSGVSTMPSSQLFGDGVAAP